MIFFPKPVLKCNKPKPKYTFSSPCFATYCKKIICLKMLTTQIFTKATFISKIIITHSKFVQVILIMP